VFEVLASVVRALHMYDPLESLLLVYLGMLAYTLQDIGTDNHTIALRSQEF
jgi:hypothetical protein